MAYDGFTTTISIEMLYLDVLFLSSGLFLIFSIHFMATFDTLTDISNKTQ